MIQIHIYYVFLTRKFNRLFLFSVEIFSFLKPKTKFFQVNLDLNRKVLYFSKLNITWKLIKLTGHDWDGADSHSDHTRLT